MANYYDYVLGFIPLALFGITLTLTIVGFSLTTAIPMASVVAVGIMGHAMFVRSPTGGLSSSEPTPSEPETKPTQIQSTASNELAD